MRSRIAILISLASITTLTTLTTLTLALAGCPPPSPVDDAGVDDVGDAGVDAGVDERDAGVGEPLDIDTFCASFHGAVCDGFASCGCALEGRAFDAASCLDVRFTSCRQALAEAAPLVESGVVTIDPVSAAACNSAVAALVEGCRILDQTTLPASCAVFLLDSAGLDDDCALAQTPALCAGGAGICAGATCAALPGADAPCVGGLLCAPGLACNQGTCGAPVPPPAPLDEGAACFDTAQCAAGLACGDGACAPGLASGAPCGGPVCGSGDACVRDYEERVCGARAPLGAACVITDEGACEDGLVCDGAACVPLPVEGETCGANRECAAPLLCDDGNGFVCVTPPGEDEPCLIGSALCAIGLGCDADNVCVPGPGAGEACLIPNNLCADGLACDFTADGSLCAERRAAGGVCQNDGVCQDGLFCGDGGTCTATRAIGEPCPTGGGCSATDECNDLDVGFTCQPVPDTAGARCSADCGADLACTGLGGSCAKALCASP